MPETFPHVNITKYTVMETHQRYFALYTKEGKLINKFVTITNYIGNEFENIKAEIGRAHV